MLGLLQRLVEEETGEAQAWEAEELPMEVADAYRTLESLREKQRTGELGANRNDLRSLERAQRIVRQWETDNAAPTVEIPVTSDTPEEVPDPVEVNPDARPVPEESVADHILEEGLVPDPERPAPEGEEAPHELKENPERPMPDEAHAEASPESPRLHDLHAAELRELREGIRAARAELELLEHRLNALVNSNS